jgi:hypothetical protein
MQYVILEKSVPVKGYLRTRHGKLERVKPTQREIAYVHTPPTYDSVPSRLTAIGPSGKTYVVDSPKLYPTSRQMLTYGNLSELQKTSPSTRIMVKMGGKDQQIEVRWLALSDLKKPEEKPSLENYPPPPLTPKGTPYPGQYIMYGGTWAKVEKVDSAGVVVKKIYDKVNECPVEVDPDAEYRLTYQDAIKAKELKEQWESFYIRHFFGSTPVAKPRDEIERQIMLMENERLRYKKDVEQANVYDRSGKLVMVKNGTYNNVFFTDDEVPKLRGTIVTHNHPVPSPFSSDDVVMAFRWGLSEIRAVTENYLYVLKPPKGQEMFDPSKASNMNYIFLTANSLSYQDFKEALDAGRVNISDMNEVGWDDVLNRFAQRSGVRYERFRWPDAKPRQEGGYL